MESTQNENCGICRTILENDIVCLLCNHKYHYECIKSWYKKAAHPSKDSYSIPKRKSCPYCLKYGGYLSFKDGEEEYDKDLHDPKYIKYEVKKRCKGFLWNGVQCHNYGRSEYNGYCGVHKKFEFD